MYEFNAGAYSYYSGSVDEVRIYNHALSSGEVFNLYNSNLAKYDENIWKFTYNTIGLSAIPGYNYIFS